MNLLARFRGKSNLGSLTGTPGGKLRSTSGHVMFVLQFDHTCQQPVMLLFFPVRRYATPVSEFSIVNSGRRCRTFVNELMVAGGSGIEGYMRAVMRGSACCVWYKNSEREGRLHREPIRARVSRDTFVGRPPSPSLAPSDTLKRNEPSRSLSLHSL